MSLATLRQLEAKEAEITACVKGGMSAEGRQKLKMLQATALTYTAEGYLAKVKELIEAEKAKPPEGVTEAVERTNKAVDTLGELGRAAVRCHLTVKDVSNFGPVGQSPYDLVPVNPCHVAQATEPKPEWHTLRPAKITVINTSFEEIPLIAPDTFFVNCQAEDERRFVSLLDGIPESVAVKLHDLFRAAQEKAKTFNSLYNYLERVAATNPDLYMPYKMVLPVNAPTSAQTIIPTPQHPFDAAKDAKAKAAKEAEAKKAAEAAKVKAERDEKVGNAISRAFR